MTIAKQMEVRSNIKKYFDIAFNGDPVIVPRKGNKNVVIISEEEYNSLEQLRREAAYASALSSRRSPEKSPSPDSSDIKSDNLRKLSYIAALKEGWNGNGAPAFDKKLISKVRELLENLSIQPEVFPTALQTIQLEYDNSRRDHMEIEVGLSNTAEIFLVRYDGSESFEQIPADADHINKKAGAFYG
ncbi:MAG: type II toxin-antitoxin system Phd/YefM family antitoxin [Lachnospiraceae bacterium]|nr:type II toxin-antitoxin system Phd/YefM family antitoxin [Lachnospiraceae bacterium]